MSVLNVGAKEVFVHVDMNVSEEQRDMRKDPRSRGLSRALMCIKFSIPTQSKTKDQNKHNVLFEDFRRASNYLIHLEWFWGSKESPSMATSEYGGDQLHLTSSGLVQQDVYDVAAALFSRATSECH
ncbi:MAG: hypothetical protein VR66_17180 [Peptococcaceae bacterium BRH_c23]|nr:MAG: hypothetical protein VR66_17180 [Peptococcaceae bacterium BRH_c23]KJS80015.1 MAG: hypothetical protein JL57_28890 [Desulfosporosinus sp. BICA1-9]HBW36070.1 hypothetical protein [Desulfosporosinus sp.]